VKDAIREEFPHAVELKTATPEYLADLESRAATRRLPPALPRRKQDTAILDQWVTFLSPLFASSGSVHFTGTYSDEYGYANGLMHPRNVFKDFGSFYRSLKRTRQEPLAIGVEKHPGGRKILHLHALIGGSWDSADRERLTAEWRRHRGWATATEVHDREGCVGYAAKHLMKQDAEDCFDIRIPARNGSRHERRRVASNR